jgi:hypothetical protein
MPRGPRLDAPGTLYHVIVRGIERRKIVDNDKDRENLGRSTSGVAQILRRSGMFEFVHFVNNVPENY